ncbi:MAG TPA: hypothetical protein VF435_03930 [Pyrinomonadaceae bacterium]
MARTRNESDAVRSKQLINVWLDGLGADQLPFLIFVQIRLKKMPSERIEVFGSGVPLGVD